MSMTHLGEQFDIHTGGIDHKSIHHPNEIAQSEAATGKSPFVKYWVHHNFLTIEGEKMSKSLGNLYTVANIIEKGFEPTALRYMYLQTHYRKQLNFTFEALSGAQAALSRLQWLYSP
jgi:cysteinyl-tRNA synthetase